MGINSPEDTKKIFHIYTRALRQVIDHNLDQKKSSELRSLLGEIDFLIDKKEFSVTLPPEFLEVKALQRAVADESDIATRLKTFEEKVYARSDYPHSTLEREVRYTSCLIKAKEAASDVAEKGNTFATPHELVTYAEKAKSRLMATAAFSNLDAKKKEAALTFFTGQLEAPFATIIKAQEQRQIEAGQRELESIKSKIEEGAFSLDELKAHQVEIRQQLAALDGVESSVLARYNAATGFEKSQFFDDYIQERLRQNRQVASLVRTIDKLLSAKIGAPTAAQAKKTFTNMDQPVVDITAACKKTGFRLWADGAKDAIISAAAWTTGSRDLLATSATTYSYAMQTLGATATFALYAGLGSFVGNFSHLGAIAYGVGAVALSGIMPSTKKAVMPQASYTVQLLTGPVVMASYAVIAPVTYALMREQLTPLRDAQNAVNHNVQQLKKTIDATQEHAQALDKTIPEVKKCVEDISDTTKGMKIGSDNIQNTLTDMKKELVELRSQPDNVQKVVYHTDNIVSKGDVLDGQVDKMVELNQGLQSKVVNLEQKNGLLQGQVGQLQADGKALIINNSKLQESVSTLQNIINPQRNWWDVFSDSALGGAVGAAGVGLFFIPGMQVPGALLIASGAGYATGYHR